MTPGHRQEQTGSSSLDRIQANVRDLISFAKQLLVRVVRTERTFGYGIVRASLLDVSRDLTAEEFAAGQVVFLGTLTAARTVTIPRATDPTAYFRWFYNGTSGGFNVTIQNQDGSLALVPATQYGVWVSGSGPGAASAA